LQNYELGPIVSTHHLENEATWLELFHRGDRATLEACYRDNFDTVEATVGRFLWGADRETVVHEIFFALISEESLRCNFKGGSFLSWLRTVSRNRAIDWLRKHQRLTLAGDKALEDPQLQQSPEQAWRAVEQQDELKRLIDYIREAIPESWKDVFQLRFVDQLSQRDAAKKLRLSRTTLAYREIRIRRVIRRYILSAAVESP